MDKKVLAIPLTIFGIILFIIALRTVVNQRNNIESEQSLFEQASRYEIAEGCVLTIEFDDRWLLLKEFGIDYNISHEVDTCGFMRLRFIGETNLTKENLPEFVDLVIDLTHSPPHTGGFTAEDIYPLLEELGLFEYYLDLLDIYG